MIHFYFKPTSPTGLSASNSYLMQVSAVNEGGESTKSSALNVMTSAGLAIVDTVDTPGNALGVTVSGSYAYVADYTSGLQVEVRNASGK